MTMLSKPPVANLSWWPDPGSLVAANGCSLSRTLAEVGPSVRQLRRSLTGGSGSFAEAHGRLKWSRVARNTHSVH